MPEEERFLVNFMKERRSMAGDGGNFKKAAWEAAAAELRKSFPSRPKTWSACKTKWQSFKRTSQTVTRIMGQSAFAWDHERGADIQPESAGVWESYVAKNPKAIPFRNRGWHLYEEFADFARPLLRGRRSHQNFRAPSLTAAQPSSSSGNSGEHSSKSNRTGGPSADSPHPSPQVSVLSTTQRSEVTAPHRTEVTTASVARSNTEPPFTFAPPTPHPRPSQFNTQVTQQSTSVHAQGHVRSASGDTHPTPSREGSISHHSSSLPSRGRAIGHHSSISSARGRSISRQSSIPPIPTGIKRRHSDMDSSETPSLSHSDSGSKRSRIAALNKIGDAFQTYNIICQNAGIAAQATSLLQRTEDLPYEAILAIIDIFRTDSAAAEIYLTLEPEDLRRAWVRRELKKVNFVLPSESGPSGSGSGESRPSF